MTGKEAIPGEEPVVEEVATGAAVTEEEILGEEKEEATEEAEKEEEVLGEEVEGKKGLPWDWLVLGLVVVLSGGLFYWFSKKKE